jgi:hypothetical protein
MATRIFIAGCVLGVILFIAASALVNQTVNFIKPWVCPDGEYVTTESSFRDSDGVMRTGTATRCVSPDGSQYQVDVWLFPINIGACVVPIVLGSVLAWFASKLFPSRPESTVPTVPGP